MTNNEEVEARYKYLKDNSAQIDYEELMALGAKRHEGNCSIWEKQHGYPYFFVTLKLAKRVSIEWSPEDKRAILTKIDKHHSIIFQIPMQTLHQMRVLVQFYQAKECKGTPTVGLLMHEKDMPKACTCPESLYA